MGDKREVLRFPQFLHLIRLLTKGNVAGLNDAADKVLKRAARTNEFLTMVSTTDGSVRGRRRRSALVNIQTQQLFPNGNGGGARPRSESALPAPPARRPN